MNTSVNNCHETPWSGALGPSERDVDINKVLTGGNGNTSWLFTCV